MLTNVDENSSTNCWINFERQFRQLLIEFKSNELMLKTTQENLKNCLKRCNLLEHELETERLNKSLIKMELDTLASINTCYSRRNVSNSEFDMNILIHDREYLTNKIFKIQVENMELKQEITKSNCQISSLMKNQLKFSQQMNQVTSMFNSLEMELRKLENESYTLVKILCTSKHLSKKIICALKYRKNVNKVQLDHIQQLVKEVATIKSNIQVFIDLNDRQHIVKSYEKNTTSFNHQTHLEICKKLVVTLENENFALHKSMHNVLDDQILKNDNNNKHTK